MENEEKTIEKNKRISAITVLSVVFIITAFILMNSTLNDTVYFHHIHNRNTGEPIGFVASILLYLLFWWFVGLVPSACVFLFMLFLYCFLHRKDKRLIERNYHPKYEEEFYYGGAVAFISTYIVALGLMILHITNIATIKIF